MNYRIIITLTGYMRLNGMLHFIRYLCVDINVVESDLVDIYAIDLFVLICDLVGIFCKLYLLCFVFIFVIKYQTWHISKLMLIAFSLYRLQMHVDIKSLLKISSGTFC